MKAIDLEVGKYLFYLYRYYKLTYVLHMDNITEVHFNYPEDNSVCKMVLRISSNSYVLCK